MNIGKILKVMQYNMLIGSGVAVTPDQFGLKAEDINPAGGSVFSKILSANGQPASPQALPKPPTPPEDPTDAKAQARFNQEMVAYNQRLFAMNQRMLQMVMVQMRQAQGPAAARSPGLDAGPIGTGGILEGDSST